ncbi:unnamed protein product [Protopolystoma xenopodis]|uniref:Uncharacterized protein n=1 Tax=Protopolystoma xenopodis TaxID=117903 RepID=A0A3S5AKT5_9PLAT|nr:unnamed protein product [Protopolystoma xenopodis]
MLKVMLCLFSMYKLGPANVGKKKEILQAGLFSRLLGRRLDITPKHTLYRPPSGPLAWLYRRHELKRYRFAGVHGTNALSPTASIRLAMQSCCHFSTTPVAPNPIQMPLLGPQITGSSTKVKCVDNNALRMDTNDSGWIDEKYVCCQAEHHHEDCLKRCL